MSQEKHRFKVDKLVRDKMPDMLRAKGVVVFEQVMSANDYIKSLKEKIHEEVKELFAAKTKEHRIEELADVLEVVYAYAQAHNISLEALEKQRQTKAEERGGFGEKRCVFFVEVDPQSPEFRYYITRSDEYPEVKIG